MINNVKRLENTNQISPVLPIGTNMHMLYTMSVGLRLCRCVSVCVILTVQGVVCLFQMNTAGIF